MGDKTNYGEVGGCLRGSMGVNLSVVVTVKNDEEGVKKLLADLKRQSVKPDEIIIIKSEEYGNCTRGRGRNIGIRMARNEFIAVTDVGCRPDRKWLEKIDGQMAKMVKMAGMVKMARKVKNVKKVERLKNQSIVIAGWYRALAETPWQKAFLSYLVPKMKIGKRAFLPASRSIAFTKKAWELVGGYPEEPVFGGEDLKFADKLCNHPGINIIYLPKAGVQWPIPANLLEFIKDMVKHTRGNFEAGYWPHIVRNLSMIARWTVMAVWPWVIPGYLILGIRGIGEIREIWGIKVIRGMTVRLVADIAVVYGSVIAIIDGWVIKKLRSRASDG